LAGGAAEQPAGSARAHARLGISACGRSRGGQGGPDAGCAVVTVSAFVSGIRCPVSGASVRCSTGPVQVTGVRCGRLSVQVSTVRPPASGVRALRRPLCPTGKRSRAWRGPAAAWLGWSGAGVVARRVHDGASSARGSSLALEAGAGRAGPGGGSTWTWSSWEVVGSGPGRPGGRPR
jgi:hypothetical protein